MFWGWLGPANTDAVWVNVSESVEVRQGRIKDFNGVEQFVADAISESFYRPELNQAEIRSNQRIAEIAHPSVLKAITAEDQKVFVAKVKGALAGFIILCDLDSDMPELDWLMVAQKFQGKGIAQGLMDIALSQVPGHKKIKLGVIHYNQRAKAFYKKYGFVDTGKTAGDHLIPRTLMVREAQVTP